ncbi:MAG: amidohydrolase family protein [Bryobacterales bacterium]
MQTPWGDLEVRDAHAHLFSYSFFEALRGQQREPAADVETLVSSLGWRCPPRDNAQLAAEWATELDRHGVASSVMMASIPGDEDAAAEVVRAQPERFHGYFMFNPREAKAVARAQRAFELGLQGLCLFPAMQRYSVRDESLSPLFELAARTPGAVVFIHCGVLSVGVRKKLGLASPFDMSCSNPLDVHRVALAFPKLRFVIPHFGAGMFRETLMLGDLCPNVYLDTSSSNSWTKFLTPEPSLDDVFRQALDVYGADRMLFGTDSSFFPRGWNRAVFDAHALERIGVSEEDAAKILGVNLAACSRGELVEPQCGGDVQQRVPRRGWRLGENNCRISAKALNPTHQARISARPARLERRASKAPMPPNSSTWYVFCVTNRIQLSTAGPGARNSPMKASARRPASAVWENRTSATHSRKIQGLTAGRRKLHRSLLD